MGAIVSANVTACAGETDPRSIQGLAASSTTTATTPIFILVMADSPERSAPGFAPKRRTLPAGALGHFRRSM
jgi:hypothetical protein